MPIDPFKLDDPRIQKGLEAIAAKLAKRAKNERNLPYYNEETALKVKAWLDELHLKGEPLRVLGSTSTIRLKYYQGSKYLYEKLDSKYEEIVQCTRCVTSSKYIELSVRENRLQRSSYSAAGFSRDEFVEYLNTSTQGSKFYRETILTPEEIDWINGLLTPLGPIFVSSVTEREVKVIRVEA